MSHLNNRDGLMINIFDAQVVLADGSVKWASTDADLLFGIKGAGLSMGGTYASLIFTYELLASFKFEISCPRIACKSIPKAHLYLQWISCLPDCYEQESVRHVTSHATLSLSLATNKPRFSNHWSAGAS